MNQIERRVQYHWALFFDFKITGEAILLNKEVNKSRI